MPRRKKQLPAVSPTEFRKRLVGGVRRGVLITVLLVAAKVGLELTPFGHDLDLWSYARMHLNWFKASSLEDDLKVVVVDSSNIPIIPIDAASSAQLGLGGKGQTDRAALGDLVEAIAEHGPYAIGVDIDMSPQAGLSTATPETIKFLERCAQIQTTKRSHDKQHPIRIVLAVGNRGQFATEDERFGSADEGHVAMAASATGFSHDFRRLPLSLQQRLKTFVDGKELVFDGLRISGFAQALAEGTADRMPAQSTLFSEVSEFRPQDFINGWLATAYWVDYSDLNQLKQVAWLVPSPATVSVPTDGERSPNRYRQIVTDWQNGLQGGLANRIVIIGDVSNIHSAGTKQDAANWPNIGAVPIPGSLVHACGVMTLIKGPVRLPTGSLRIVIDLVLAIGIILAVQWLRWHYFTKGQVASEHALHIWLTSAAVGFVVIGAFLLAYAARTLWTDFWLVALALIVHGTIERWVAAGKQLWRYTVLTPDEH